jgi:hypothetical protein
MTYQELAACRLHELAQATKAHFATAQDPRFGARAAQVRERLAYVVRTVEALGERRKVLWSADPRLDGVRVVVASGERNRHHLCEWRGLVAVQQAAVGRVERQTVAKLGPERGQPNLARLTVANVGQVEVGEGDALAEYQLASVVELLEL